MDKKCGGKPDVGSVHSVRYKRSGTSADEVELLELPITNFQYIPCIQTNFVLGLGTQAGSEPFELTKRFLDMTPGAVKPRLMNVLRAVSSEGFGRIKYFTEVRRLLHTDLQFRHFFEWETSDIPHFHTDLIKKDLWSLWNCLPSGGMYHDPNSYLNAETLRTRKESTLVPQLVEEGKA